MSSLRHILAVIVVSVTALLMLAGLASSAQASTTASCVLHGEASTSPNVPLGTGPGGSQPVADTPSVIGITGKAEGAPGTCTNHFEVQGVVEGTVPFGGGGTSAGAACGGHYVNSGSCNFINIGPTTVVTGQATGTCISCAPTDQVTVKLTVEKFGGTPALICQNTQPGAASCE